MSDEHANPKEDNPPGETPPAADPKSKIPAGVMSHEGQARPTNEDSVLDVDLEKKSGEARDMKLVAVADGAGGMAAGKIASNITVRAVKHSIAGSVADSIEQLASDAEDDPYASWLAAAVKAANFLVHIQAQQHQAKMASTLVMALIEGERVHIANVGDSRAYIVNQYGLRQITQDHSAAQELLDAGLIRFDEVKGHPFEHVLTRAIGPEEDVEPDLYRELISAGDRLLLCTDGLTNMITEAQIWEIVYNAPDPQTAAQQLIDAANQSGGKDNITAVVVEIQH